MRRISSLFLFFGLLGAFPAMAAPSKMPLDLHRTAPEVKAQIKVIQEQLADGATYSEIAPEQRSQVSEALGRITAKLEWDGAVSRISGSGQADAFNDQEVINTILTKAKDDSRLVCKHERATGSNRLSSNCMTVAERRRLKEQGQKAIRDLRDRNVQVDPRAAN
jgi:hypothetical protein